MLTPLRKRALGAALVLLSPAILAGAPVAADDTYNVSEDQVLNATGGLLFDESFDAQSPSATWQFLDRIENALGRGDSYPVDGASRAWNVPAFDTATSTIQPWSAGTLPIQSGAIGPFPGGLPDLLYGIDAAPNGTDNIVTTYLFRGSMVLDAAQAATANWNIRLLADDGCIIYINGTEVERFNMDPGQYNPAGPVTTETLTNSSSEAYADLPVDLTGVLVAGVNTIAVELHQASLDSSDAGFDFTLSPAGAGAGSGGFVFSNFGTQNAQSNGSVDAIAGFAGNGLLINVGGSSNSASARGGWQRGFSMAASGTVTLDFRYRMILDAGYETDEYSEIYVAIDGTPYGLNGNAYLDRRFGDNNGGANDDTGWRQATLEIPLAAGTHTLTLGLFNSKSTVASETTVGYFDDVSMLLPGGILANDSGDPATLASALVTGASNGSVSLNTDGTFVYTPDADFFGTDSFTYEATDGTGTSAPATVTITVTSVNDAPVAVANGYFVIEDTTLALSVPLFGVLGNDSDPENDPLTAVLADDVQNGTLSLNADGTFTYAPDPNFSGADTFTYRASDGLATSDPVTVTLTVQPVNDPPAPADDAYTTFQNQPLNVTAPLGAGTSSLVTAGSVWKYLDDGSDQGSGWISPLFDDSGWASGAAKLGYGDGDEATVVSFGPDSGNKYPTTYFRRAFQVTGVATIGKLTLSLRRDDGAAVYLNGVEIVRDGLATGAGFDDYALFSVGGADEQTFFQFDVDPALLVEGSNLLAVEVHQATPASSDLGFDLTLDGESYAGVLANDTDPENDPLTAQILTQPAHGGVVLNGDGTFVYTPDNGYQGVDTFTYEASDAEFSQSATVTVTVIRAGNTSPVAVADAYAVQEDETLVVGATEGVLANDSDAEMDPLILTVTLEPANGTLTMSPDGAFTYVPDANFNGSDFFTYSINDGLAVSPSVEVTLEVTPVNDPPVTQDDTYVIDENALLEADQAVSAGSSNQTLVPLGSVWSYLDDGSNQGTAWRAPGFDDSAWQTGAAELGYGDGDEVTEVSFGPDSNNKYPTTYFRHRFTVTNAELVSDLTLFLDIDDGGVIYLNGLPVVSVNMPGSYDYQTYASPTREGGTFTEHPVDTAALVNGVNVIAVEVHQNTASSSDITMELRLEATVGEVVGVLANDSDIEGDTLTASVLVQPQHGSVVMDPDGTFVYTPNANYDGTDSFTYAAGDGTDTTPGTVTITILPGPNSIPETMPDSYAVDEDGSLVVDALLGVLANDTDPEDDALTVSVVGSPGHGQLALAADGSFVYVPDANFSGSDVFSYVANDGAVNSQATQVTITVNPVDDPPVTLDDSYVLQPGGSLTVPTADGVLANDAEVDGQGMTAQLATTTASGTLSLAADGSFTYAPNGGFVGTDTFTYRASDGVLVSGLTTVTLYVNSRPNAQPDSYSIAEDTTLDVPVASGVLDNDSDPTNEPLSAVLVSPPAGGVLSLQPSGAFVYVPASDFFGQVSFVYTANDPVQPSLPTTVFIDVTPVNDAPVGADDSFSVQTVGSTVVGAAEGVLANDSDIDSVGLLAVLETTTQNGALTFGQDGSFVYTPGVGFAGIDSFTYRVSDGALTSDPVTVVLTDIPETSAVVISEIMYHPGSESPAEEYIELYNRATFPIDLEGWRISKGVDFTFPQVTIPAGGYVVVAADPVAFEAVYGAGATVVGPWVGLLSNSGELIRLKNDLDATGDEVEYADQGDWARRVRVTLGGEDGWDWFAAHDGGGQSLELINPEVSNKNGQNWASSIGAPTPGGVNTVAAADIAPLISDVAHAPAVPKSTDPITITAQLKDVDGSPLTASLRYRLSTASPGPFIEIPMFDDGAHGDGAAGDGTFGVTLSARPNLSVIEFYVRASDGTNIRTWPAPTDQGQVANALFQFNDETYDGQHLVYHLIMTAAENQAFTDITRTSNAEQNTTLIIDDCSDTPKVRYLCGTRVRGAGSRNHTPVPRRVNIPRDVPVGGSTRMNLNTRFPYLQYVGMKLFRLSGMAAPDTRAIIMRRNGADEMRGDNFDYGLAVHVEPLSGEFVDDKFPDDNQGNLYKKVRPDNDWAYRSGDVNSYISDGWLKETNASEGDYSDLDEFLRVMNQADADPDYVAQVEAVANVDQWMKWFAANAILANGETNAANGADDDYSMYRGAIDPRFVFVPHDLDTILGRGDGSAITNPQHTIFDMLERGDVLDPLVPFFSNAQIRQRYFTAMRGLLQGAFSQPAFDELLDNQLAGWVPANVIGEMKTFMNQRRAHIAGLIDAELGPPSAPPAATTRGSLAIGHGSLFISEVLAVNVAAHANGTSFPDAVELRNVGATAADLSGMSLSDDPADPAKFVFAPGTTIPPGGYLVVYADANLADPGIHLGFQLDGDGETLTFYDAAQQVLDSIAYGLQIADLSIGRTGVNAGVWTLTQPSLGSANTAVSLGNPDTLRINEWMAQPELVFEDDFVEIYNPDALPVALGGMSVTDDSLTQPLRHVLPDLSYMAGGGFLVLTGKGADASPGNASELPFKLDSTDGWVAIAGANGVRIDEIYYDCHPNDFAQGRSPDGAATYADFLLPTPGRSNGSDLSVETAVIAGLRITEIMYNPPGGTALEYIELTNIGAQPIQLGDVRFNSGITFDFPVMMLAPGAFVLLVNDLAAFEGFYGTGLPVAGEYSGNLSNGGERLRLEIASLGAGIHDFSYDDAWYPSTDGGGFALVIADPTVSRHDWGLKESWIAGEVGGTPGANDLVVLAGLDQSVSLTDTGALEGTVFEGTATPGQLTLAWSQVSGPAGAAIAAAADEDTTVTFTLPGRYVFRLTATTPAKSSSGDVEIVVGDTYDAWVVRTFGAPNPPTTDRGTDADGDGISNFLEFLFGTDPTTPGALPVVASVENGFLALTYSLRYVDIGEYSIAPEVSADLAGWSPADSTTTSSILADTGTLMTVRITDIAPVGTDTRKFLRLKVVSAQ